jgi:transposase
MIREAMLTEEQWAKIEPLLPRLSSRGRPWQDNRAVLEGILWVLRSGARWKDLPEQFPSPATCWRRLRKWEEDGTWLRAWRTLIASLDDAGRLSWEEVFMDASFSPAKKGGPESERPNAERVRSGWWWEAARVFLWESSPRRPRRRR